ncbi:MAG: IS200/IS605 family transposase [Candidatus Cloacimonetes bacterium]|nr:IS200/IS605 family transposase [Candidatus Cloacimonadota bacterium]
MPNTYAQIYIHLVFSVKCRYSLIKDEWQGNLFKNIASIVENRKQKLIIINGTQDHIHLLVSFKPNHTVSDLVRDIKSNSTKFINENGWAYGKFQWQIGFGAFSVSQSKTKTVYSYIQNQQEHHKKQSFIEEYKMLLKMHNIPYDDAYIFDEIN